ncbi:type II secretion system F family protein [Providencia rettgeri]|uniref:Type II secretion system F family protein n=1 Tax=Providencia stuartii TaxID=588 RepID=A0AAI9DDE4_PROST|nr:type II secretion system F family protein [Providencia stuartii]ELR5113746.1 type II secretion system F family protein [Providencia stuartii]MDV5227042.1 type II secretion system F family protein [Providencia rettgeri]
MRKFSKKQRLYMYKFCADMIQANLPLYDSILKLKEEGLAILGKSFVKKIDALLNRMTSGESISYAFEPYIPKEELSLIYSSEKSGALAEGFEGLIDIITYKDMLSAKIKKALAFPIIMICLSLVVIAGYSVKVFPAFEKVLPSNRWPGVTSSLYNFGLSLVDGLWINILISAIVIYFLINFLLANVKGKIRDDILDRVIPFSIYKKVNAAVLMTSIASMLQNRIPIQEALNIISLNANKWLLYHVTIMSKNMSTGLNYGDALNTGIFDKQVLLNISLYSSLPSFYDVLNSVSEITKKNILMKIEGLANGLKSFSTLVLGGCVIWVFIALFSLSDQLSKMSAM